MILRQAVCALALVGSTAAAHAEITVCITVAATGPAASLGIPEKNTVALLPASIAGEKINYVVFDDATDATNATRNIRKCLEENKGDVIIGSSATPPSLAVASVAKETKTPAIALSPVEPPPDAGVWSFRTPQHVSQMASAILAHMKANGVRTIGFIGYSDAYGEDWLRVMRKALEGSGIKLDPVERFARTDTSVAGQVLKLVAARPDAVLIVASGTPAALPQTTLAERGYKGRIYQTHGAASRDFIRIGGKAVEGTILPVGPVVVASQLPDSHPSKTVAQDYAKRYEEVYGAGTLSSFGAHMFDAARLLEASIPVALKTAKPGTPEFRQALRDALEGVREVVGAHGVFNMKPDDHFGHDARSRVLVTVKDGDWKLISAD